MVNEKNIAESVLETLLDQRDGRIERGFYWENQIAFAYNSEKMEGNPSTRTRPGPSSRRGPSVPSIPSH